MSAPSIGVILQIGTILLTQALKRQHQPVQEKPMTPVPLQVIRTESEYEAALMTIEPMFDNGQIDPLTPEGIYFETLCILIEDYESRHCQLEDSAMDPITYIQTTMDVRGLSETALVPCFGTKKHAKEVLTRQRKLTLPMIRHLVETFQFLPEKLISKY